MIHETLAADSALCRRCRSEATGIEAAGCAAPQADTGAYATLYRNFFSGGLDIRPFPPDPSTGLLGGLPSDSC